MTPEAPGANNKRALDPEMMASTDVYKVIAGCVVPRPIGFISTVSRDGIHNAAPFSFFNAISHNPPMVCISISPIYKSGQRKDTLKNITDVGDFVANIVNEELAAAQDRCSNDFAPEVDEFREAGLTAGPSKLVRSPRIEESPVNLECRLVQVMPLHPSPYTLVIGRVVLMHVRADLVQPNGRIDAARLAAIGRMTGNAYTRTRDLFTLEHDTFEVLPTKA
jgi:flavin reductase (DIM6/NTAB) family NADH-FMN oxidoreductase RutF